jgi:hypothetical protein
VLAVAEQPLLVATKHLDHLLDRLQATSHCVVRPSFEEISGRALVPIAPKGRGERGLDGLEVGNSLPNHLGRRHSES